LREEIIWFSLTDKTIHVNAGEFLTILAVIFTLEILHEIGSHILYQLSFYTRGILDLKIIDLKNKIVAQGLRVGLKLPLSVTYYLNGPLGLRHTQHFDKQYCNKKNITLKG
jgi:hypothetical protein